MLTILTDSITWEKAFLSFLSKQKKVLWYHVQLISQIECMSEYEAYQEQCACSLFPSRRGKLLSLPRKRKKMIFFKALDAFSNRKIWRLKMTF